MSYDLRLCLPEEGCTREETATRDWEDDPFPPSAADVQRLQRLAAALRAALPTLGRTDAGADTEAGADSANREGGDNGTSVIELSALDDASGLQVTLTAREAGLTIPYWDRPEGAEAALAAMWRCAEVLEKEGGYFTHDQQVGRILDLKADFPLVVSTYRRALARVANQQSGCTTPSRPRRIFPRELDRGGYFLHWLGLSTVALALGYGILQLTLGTRAETLVLVPAAAWFIAKMLVIDPARLRSIGWPPALTFLSLFPPAALGLQLLLFLLSPREH